MPLKQIARPHRATLRKGSIQMPFDDDDCVIGPPLSSVEVHHRDSSFVAKQGDQNNRRWFLSDSIRLKWDLRTQDTTLVKSDTESRTDLADQAAQLHWPHPRPKRTWKVFIFHPGFKWQASEHSVEVKRNRWIVKGCATCQQTPATTAWIPATCAAVQSTCAFGDNW